MTSPFQLHFAHGQVDAISVSEMTELPSALGALGLHAPRATVVVVGGAGGLDEAAMERLRILFTDAIIPVMQNRAAVGVDGGTLSGVMRLFGEAHSALAATFPLVGVAAAGTVQLPERPPPRTDAAALEPHHTHFVIVPGDEWGTESPWIAHTATVLTRGAPSLTILLNGGEIAYSDVERSVQAGREVVVIDGSGRTADAIASALAGASQDERASVLAKSRMIRSAPVDDPPCLAALLAAALDEPEPT